MLYLEKRGSWHAIDRGTKVGLKVKPGTDSIGSGLSWITGTATTELILNAENLSLKENDSPIAMELYLNRVIEIPGNPRTPQ